MEALRDGWFWPIPGAAGPCEEDLLGGCWGGLGRPVPVLAYLTGTESPSLCTLLGVSGSESAAVAA
jgi:hypothetical protein